MQKEFPLVTIVVPCYNHAKYIEETIKSIVNQTYKNIELIVIDDGSKDNSVQVIKSLVKVYDFTFIARENRGLSKTLNEGINLAKGKYFSACASDDKLVLNKIELQVAFMEQNSNCGMCYAKTIFFDDEGNEQKENISKPKSGWIFNELLAENFIPAVTQFIRKDVLLKVGKFDETLKIEDWDMWLRIAKEYKIGYVDKYLAYYRRHDDNVSKNAHLMIEEEKKIINKWNTEIVYDKALVNRKLFWFNYLAIDNKLQSLKYIFTVILNINNTTAVRGLIKFFLPYFILKKVIK